MSRQDNQASYGECKNGKPAGAAIQGLALATLLLGTSLAGCDLGEPSRMSERIEARQAQQQPPELWRVEQIRRDGAIQGVVQVCVAPVHLVGFRRPAAEVNGQPCVTYGPAVSTDEVFATSCAVGAIPFKLRVTTKGDTAEAFETWFSLTPVADVSSTAVQDRRYRRLGACPTGWRIGQQKVLQAGG
jgi:hypothetical protein